jgi:hypothetical protein
MPPVVAIAPKAVRDDGLVPFQLAQPCLVDATENDHLVRLSQVTTLLAAKQPLDATLTALAAVVTAANKLIYSTGVDTFATADLTAYARTVLAAVDAAAARTTLGLGSLAVVTPTGTPDGSKFLRDDLSWQSSVGGSHASSHAEGGADRITSLALANTGLAVRDTDDSHELVIAPGSNLSANRTLSLVTGDADRTLTLGGNSTLNGGAHSGTNTGDQTVSLTGDVTGSGTGSFAATIASDAVTNAKLANVSTATMKGRATAGTGDPEDLSVAQVRALLGIAHTEWTETGDPVRTVGASSTTEQDVVSVTIPHGDAGANGVWCLHIWGDFLQNSGAANVSRLRIKLYDGTSTTTVYDKANSFSNASGRRGFVARIYVVPKGSATSLRIAAEMYLSQPLAATAGFGDWGAFAATHGGLDSGDTTVVGDPITLTLSVTHQWDTSHANSYLRIYGAKLVLQP